MDIVQLLQSLGLPSGIIIAALVLANRRNDELAQLRLEMQSMRTELVERVAKLEALFESSNRPGA